MNLLVLTQKVNQDDAILGFFVEWLDRMAQRADRVQVIALEKKECALPANVEVFSLGREEGAGPFTMLTRFNRILWNLCRKQKPDAMLVHMVPRFVLYAFPLCALFRIPIHLWYTHKGVDRYLRMAHPFIRNAFTASEESFRLKSSKKVVTGHGIDTMRFTPSEEGVRRGIVTVGRITPSKDQEIILEALALLKGRWPVDDLETRIVGEPLLEGDRIYLERLKSLVKERSLEELVAFDGAVPHRGMSGCYRRARILVNASHTGSVDKVVLEAMASGTLPLTCNEAFVPLLGDFADRLVFEKGRPDDLADRLDTLLNMDEDERRDLAAGLRKIVVENHNLDRLMDKLFLVMSE